MIHRLRDIEFFLENGCQKYAKPHVIASMTNFISKYMFLGSRNPIKGVSSVNKQYLFTSHGYWG